MGLWIFLILNLFLVIVAGFVLFKETCMRPEKAQRIKKKNVQFIKFRENLANENNSAEEYIANNTQKIDDYLNKKFNRKKGTPQKDK